MRRRGAKRPAPETQRRTQRRTHRRTRRWAVCDGRVRWRRSTVISKAADVTSGPGPPCVAKHLHRPLRIGVHLLEVSRKKLEIDFQAVVPLRWLGRHRSLPSDHLLNAVVGHCVTYFFSIRERRKRVRIALRMGTNTTIIIPYSHHVCSKS